MLPLPEKVQIINDFADPPVGMIPPKQDRIAQLMALSFMVFSDDTWRH